MKHTAWFVIVLLVCSALACNKTKDANLAQNSNAAKANTGSAAFITEIHMAKDDGHGGPGEEASVFGPQDRTIHCVAKLKEARDGTRLRFSWWVVDAEGAKNEKIQDVDYTASAKEDVVHAHLTLPEDWPRGKYKVEVFVNGELDRTIGFTVD